MGSSETLGCREALVKSRAFEKWRQESDGSEECSVGAGPPRDGALCAPRRGRGTGAFLSGENGWKWNLWVQSGARAGSAEVTVKGLPVRPS